MALTEQQRGVVEAGGDFILLACPGSGKTRSAAARIVALAGQGRKVAVCSYTNVGADRFRTVIGETGAVLGDEHFVGTLHSFLLRYVVTPFGPLVGAQRGPHPVADSGRVVAFQGDNRKRIPIDCFRWRPDGSMVLTKRPRYLTSVAHDEIVRCVKDDVRREKRALLKAGRVTFDDAIYVALQILRKWPTIARAVAGRFDELLLDEAQDTSELQLACVDELKKAGLRSLVLVGDLAQSIFAFQGASAEGCRELARTHGLDTIELTENHRCSQLICDVAAHFCDRPGADVAVGPNADCVIEPAVIMYTPNEPSMAVERFRRLLVEYGADPAEASVLGRGNVLVDELNGAQSPVEVDVRPLALGRAVVALRYGTLTHRQLDDVQRIIALAAWDEPSVEGLPILERDQLRLEAVQLLKGLPSLDGDLRAWIKEAAGLLTEAATRLNEPPAKKGGQLVRSAQAHEGIPAREAFVPHVRELQAQTVHDIKGEDRDAVLVVIDRPRNAKYVAQTQLWTSSLEGDAIPTGLAEERRIAFVALTRAQRICVVALPDDKAGRAAAASFVARRFHLHEFDDAA